MSAQCPKTCNRCNDAVQPTHAPNPAPNPNPSNCVDQINPWTGVSDCPRLRHLCNHPHYYAFMSAQCPKTCNRCNDAVQPTHAPNPAPNPNPSSGCLCNSPLYYAWMRAICPKTCNMCTDTTEQPTNPSKPEEPEPAEEPDDPPQPEEPEEPDDLPEPEEPEEPDDPPEPEEPEEETTTARATFFPRVGFGEPNRDSSSKFCFSNVSQSGEG
ncbi:shTK domain protein [Ancylostoma caninum]|uniref:ShTK domain protein n=1 Tax=Ancylostoma caninum TaxID=29170 RepID=A0A368GIW5_ANCCA|nr:shTK domain protein [Ancylostoma caninum]